MIIVGMAHVPGSTGAARHDQVMPNLVQTILRGIG